MRGWTLNQAAARRRWSYEEVEPPFENRRHSDVVEELFRRVVQIRDTRIEATTATVETTVRRGTVLQLMRELARVNDRHAYVLPGEERGASIGCFLPDPEEASDLPPLVMIGDNRSLANVIITEDPDGAEITHARVLRIDDQGTTTFETSAADLGLMRAVPAVPADLTPGVCCTQRTTPLRIQGLRRRLRRVATLISIDCPVTCSPAVTAQCCHPTSRYVWTLEPRLTAETF
jgi:hypothetical protein